MNDIKYWNEALDEMGAWADEIAGEWNGDDAGLEEDRSTQAYHISRMIEDLREQINLIGELL